MTHHEQPPRVYESDVEGLPTEPEMTWPDMRWLGFVLIGAWCLLPIFGLGMLVGALIW